MVFSFTLFIYLLFIYSYIYHIIHLFRRGLVKYFHIIAFGWIIIIETLRRYFAQVKHGVSDDLGVCVLNLQVVSEKMSQKSLKFVLESFNGYF